MRLRTGSHVVVDLSPALYKSNVDWLAVNARVNVEDRLRAAHFKLPHVTKIGFITEPGKDAHR
jgi:ABC-type uncharacterized transport system substrate-binding protein